MFRIRTAAFAMALGVALLLAPSAGALELHAGFNDNVSSITAPDANGTRYIGGSFTAWNAYETGAFAATDATTGAVDTAFPRITGDVYAIAVDGSNYTYLGGSLSCVGPNLNGLCAGAGDTTVTNLIRLNPDGSLDTSFVPFVNGYVHSIAIASGTIYVGGNFTGVRKSINDTELQRNGAAAFDRFNGNVLAWNPDLNASTTVYALAVTNAGIAVGTDKGGGQPALLMTNATTGVRTAWQPSLDGSVRALAYTIVSGVESLYVGGEFTCVGSNGDSDCADGGETVRQRGAAYSLAATPSLLAWDPSFDNTVYAMTLNGDSAYAVGEFGCAKTTATWSCTGSPISRVRGAQISLTGSGTIGAWTPNLNFVVRGIAVSGTTAYVTGNFNLASTHPRSGVAAYDLSANQLLDWNPAPTQGAYGAGARVVAIAGSRVLIAGSFTRAGGTPRLHTASLRDDGSLGNWTVPINGPVYDMELVADDVYIGGDFMVAGTATHFSLAKASTAGSGTVAAGFTGYVNGGVHDVAVSGDTVYAVGTFQNAYAETRRSAFAIDTTGSSLRDWNPDLNSSAYAIAIAADGTAYIGGVFTQAKQSASPGDRFDRFHALAISTTSAGTVTSWNPKLGDPSGDGAIQSISIGTDAVYLAGAFTCTGFNGDADCTDGGEGTRGYGAAVTTAGVLLPWDPMLNDHAHAVAAVGARIFLGGRFVTSHGQPAEHLTVVDSLTGQPSGWGASINGWVETVEATTAFVYFGGSFTNVNGGASGGIDRQESPDLHVLDLTITGSGRVASSLAELDCSVSCAVGFFRVASTTLTATPAAGQRVASWGGACSGSATTCIVATTQFRMVSVTFEAIPGTPAASNNASATSGAGGSGGANSSAAGQALTVLSATAVKNGTRLKIIVRAGSPGKLTAVGTIAGKKACSAAGKAKKAGKVTLTCTLNAAARRLTTSGPQTVSVNVRLVAATSTSNATTTVTVRR